MIQPGVIAPPAPDFEANPAGTTPRPLPVPKTPTEQEVADHILTHLPFRTWCADCVKSKGKHTQHRTVYNGLPIVQLVYAFLKYAPDDDDDQRLTLLSVFDTTTGIGIPIPVPNKGVVKFAVHETVRFLLETGRSHCIIQTDNEPAIRALATAVCKELPNCSMRQTPAYSSESDGGVERWHQTLFAQFRTIKGTLERLYSVTVQPSG